MSDDFKVTGADDLALLARRLKEGGHGELRKELLRGIRDAGKVVVPKIKQDMAEKLPRRGGFAALAAREPISVRTRTSASGASVRLFRKRGGGLLDQGRLRHPVFGNREAWAEQKVPADLFGKAIESDAPQIRRAIERVMDDIAAKIARSPL